MLRFKFALTISFLTFLLGGCATSADVAVKSVEDGVTRTYSIPYESLKRLAFESVKGLNVEVKSVEESEKMYVLNFTKPISAFSWGEVGKVVVKRGQSDSTVSVIASKRMKVQVSGTSQQEFAEAVFDGIDYAIRRK